MTAFPENTPGLLRQLADGLEQMDRLMSDANVGGPYDFYPLLYADRARAVADSIERAELSVEDMKAVDDAACTCLVFSDCEDSYCVTAAFREGAEWGYQRAIDKMRAKS